MKMTLKEMFDSYPLTKQGIADRLGRTREWLSHVANGHIKSESELYLIEEEIHSIGRELADIELVARETCETVLMSYRLPDGRWQEPAICDNEKEAEALAQFHSEGRQFKIIPFSEQKMKQPPGLW